MLKRLRYHIGVFFAVMTGTKISAHNKTTTIPGIFCGRRSNAREANGARHKAVPKMNLYSL